MPEGMKPLFMYPYGGLGLFELPFRPPVRLDPPTFTGDECVLSWSTEWPMSGYTLLQNTNLLTPDWKPVPPTNQWPSLATGWTGSLDSAMHI